MIKNEYLSIKDYEEYLSLFNLKDDDRKEINNIINKVWEIDILKRETKQDNNVRYLRPLMVPSDYKKIDKALKVQREFKIERLMEKKRKELQESGLYTSTEIFEKLEKYYNELCEEISLRKTR